jgi:hypothetical protein
MSSETSTSKKVNIMENATYTLLTQKDCNRHEQIYKATIIDMTTYKLLAHKE